MKKLINAKVTDLNGHRISFLRAVNLMDSDIFEYLVCASSDYRDKPFTPQEFYDAYEAAREIQNRTAAPKYRWSDQEGLYINTNERPAEELDSLLITIGDGRDMHWLSVLSQLDDAICSILGDIVPTLEQEYFDRHQDIYRITTGGDFYIRGAAVSSK